MSLNAIEKSFQVQESVNRLLAHYSQMSVCEYIKLNHDRVKSLSRIEELINALDYGHLELPMERIRELGYILNQMKDFTINNNFFLEGLRVEFLLTRFGQIVLSQN